MASAVQTSPSNHPSIGLASCSWATASWKDVGHLTRTLCPRQFARLIDDEPAPEVLNLGVAAANFPEYLRLVRDSVPLLRPHTLFLVVCSNDLPAVPFDLPIPPPGGMASLPPRAFPSLSPFQPRVIQAFSLQHDGWVLPRRVHSGPFPFFAPVPSPSNPLSQSKRMEGLDPELEARDAGGESQSVSAGHAAVFRGVSATGLRPGGGSGEPAGLPGLVLPGARRPYERDLYSLPRRREPGLSRGAGQARWMCQSHVARFLQ